MEAEGRVLWAQQGCLRLEGGTGRVGLQAQGACGVLAEQS